MTPDIVAALPLVRHHARAFDHTPLGRDDAFGEGSLALLDAAHRFDPARGIDFPAFASRRIRGAMQDAVRTVRGTRVRNDAEVLVEETFDWGSTVDHYFGKESITDRLRGLSWEDRHVAVLVAGGYQTGEIAAAWGVDKSRISQRIARVKRHLGAAA